MAAFSEPNPGSAAGPVLADETGSPRPHPKTGERRRVRRTLRLDRLPSALLDRIRAERAQGHTWDDIERDSTQWPEWEQASPEVSAEFPDRRLPHTSLQRWHDLRVDQLLSLQEEQVAIAQEFAERLAAPGTEHLGAAVCNALSESVLRLKLEGGDEQRIRDELCRLARVVATAERTEIARRRMELEDRKYEFELREKIARQLSENAATQNREKYLVHHLKKSPVFRPYLDNLAEMQAAKAAAEAGQKEDKKAPRSPASSAHSGVSNAAETKTNAKSDDYCEPVPDDQPESRDNPPSPASSRQTRRQSGLHPRPPELDDRNATAAIMGVLWTRFAERMAKLLELNSPAAATDFEKSEPDQEPELDDGPEGGAGALARGLQSTTNSRASQPVAAGAPLENDSESDDQSGPEDQLRSENDDAKHAGSNPDNEPQPEDGPEVAPARDLPPSPAISRENPPCPPESLLRWYRKQMEEDLRRPWGVLRTF